MANSPYTPSIHILDDDSLLNVFYLYRPFLLGEDQDDDVRLFGGKGCVRGRWWYKLAHVCQRWRYLMLGSSLYLGLSLVCTKGTPVADMLANSSPLPLDIEYRNCNIAAEDEEGTILALKQRDRVRHVSLKMSASTLQKLIVSIEEEYPILECLVICTRIEDDREDNSTILTFPETLHAPHLRHLVLTGFALPIRSRLLTTAVGLVTLCLITDHPSAYFHPNTLLQWLSFMPQLETLAILFGFTVPNLDAERQLTHTPITTPVTLPNLHHIVFRGVSTYLEALVRRITTPRLEKLHIRFFHQHWLSVPRVMQLMNTAENLRFDSARFQFSTRQVYLKIYPRGEPKKDALSISVYCQHLDRQVSSMAQISNSLSRMFSAVEYLTLEHDVHCLSSEGHNEVDRIDWCKLLSSFRNVKTLRIDNGLAKELSRCLRWDDGELPLELLPKLQELTYSRSSNTGDAFTSFIDARQNAGSPTTLCNRQHS
ncbi:hypothetical protein DFH94DRAFT_691051 [Russula ochroleuca]|jgi:hypothetical protein|uniref:Uncharacterized protein n=1 Tax=Russula ochroleuca TaxID=152965 RepID=A0A9P5TB12_9AGAM|nr:hypothetical protein DFH94DRAFT_691051 [Russula ochroleuca]